MKKNVLALAALIFALGAAALIFALGATPAFSKKQLPVGWATKSEGLMKLQKAENHAVYIVKTRDELVKALMGNQPKTVYIDGIISGKEGKNGKVQTPEDYLLEAGFKPKNPNSDFYWSEFYGLNKDGSFAPGSYLDTYNLETYGKNPVTGELEDIRKAAAKLQAEDITISVGSNTRVIGVGKNSGLKDIQLLVKGVENVIIRNLTFVAVTDYFPGWDPKDGSNGNWNSEYDTLSISESTGIWIDHNTFMDAPETADYNAPILFGRLFQRHDGLLDIVRESDLITVSNNIFRDHSKTLLFGNSDGRKTDEGKLRITFNNNLIKDIGERSPRVRYGKVHILNNFYEGEISKVEGAPELTPGIKKHFVGYAIGNGIEAKIYSESNSFNYNADGAMRPDQKLVKNFKGKAFFDKGSILNGKSVDVAKFVGEGPQMTLVEMSPDVKWNPADEYKYTPLKADEVKASVMKNAGPGIIKITVPKK